MGMGRLTLYDGEQDDDDYKEEGDIKEESEHVSSRRFEHVSDASARTKAVVNVVHKALHGMK